MHDSFSACRKRLRAPYERLQVERTAGGVDGEEDLWQTSRKCSSLGVLLLDIGLKMPQSELIKLENHRIV